MTHSNESAENYLETILMLSQKLPVVRSVDIANELGYKKSSISIAMKNLKAKNQITVTDAGFIYLTDEGKEIYEDHDLFEKRCLERSFHNLSSFSKEEFKIYLSIQNKLNETFAMDVKESKLPPPHWKFDSPTF